MLRSWRLGTAFGIGLYVHWRFLMIPALVLFSNLDYGLTAAVTGATFVLAIFGCVVLHELGHALMAQSYGIGTRDITLYPIGGVARSERMPERPGAEIAIAVAGPLANVVIAVGLGLGLTLAGYAWSAGTLATGALAANFLMQLLSVNVMLVAFNLIPAFPMDG